MPLGLAAVKFWTRKKFKGTNALKRKVNPTRIPIEQKESVRWLENLRQSTELLGDPARCVHIGDRESDIYELFCVARELGTHFLVRTCVDRLAGDGDARRSPRRWARCRSGGRHRVEVRDDEGGSETAEVELTCASRARPAADRQAEALPRARPDGPARPRAGRARQAGPASTGSCSPTCPSPRHRGRGREAALVRHAVEDRDVPQGPEVGLPGRGGAAAHGRAPDQPARRPLHRRLARVLADDDRRVRARTPSRGRPDGREIALLDRLVPDRADPRAPDPGRLPRKVARLGGYLARASDPPPGNIVMWRGWSRLTDIVLGSTVAGACG